MALPINIEDLLNKHKVESNRIEFKKGWNPTKIYHSICAFANDFDNIGGGYILVGVEEKDGVAVRPVTGIPVEQLDKIQREMVNFNNMMDPFYAPRISVEEVDEVYILVIWAPSGINRPYAVPTDVKSKHNKQYAYYIRYGTTSIEAKGERLDELREMANRVPFDDRGNPDIQPADISTTLLRDYLVTVNSRLANEDLTGNLLAFPEGRENNPNNFIEAPPIKGPIPYLIKEALNYLRINVIKEQISKPRNDERSIRFFNYPYQALEEAVVNALYHRDYQLREPVEITIEPERISILSHSGPDRSISMAAIKEAKILRSRRYRNRRLGEFLKELDLTEGRATGIPTIQDELRKNGSSKATIETDDDRTYFLIDIPCHPYWHQSVELDVLNELVNKKVISSRQFQIIKLIQETPHLTQIEISSLIGVSRQTIYKDISHLTDLAIIKRNGSRKSGYWIISTLQ